MIIYRPHCGGLAESMAKMREFETELEMKMFLVMESCAVFGKPLFYIDEIIINDENMHDDDRIGWENVKSVCVKRYGNEKYSHAQCIGYCSEKYERSDTK